MNYNITVSVPQSIVESLSKYYGYNPIVIIETPDVETGGIIQTESPNPQTAVEFIAERVVSNLAAQAKEAMLSGQYELVRQGIEQAIGQNPIQVNITEAL